MGDRARRRNAATREGERGRGGGAAFFLVEQKELLFLQASSWSFFSLFALFSFVQAFSKIQLPRTRKLKEEAIGRQELLFCAPFQLPACDTALHVPQTAARPPRTLFARMRVDARRKRPRFPRKRNTQIALALAISIDDLDRLSTS